MAMLIVAPELSLSMSMGSNSGQLKQQHHHQPRSQQMLNGSIKPKRIAIIGQGIMGLTCAARLLEEIATGGGASDDDTEIATMLPPISTIDIYSKEKFEDTTSMSAGGYWWPHKAYPQHRVETWSKETYKIYKKLAKIPYETGIHMEQHVRICVDQDDSSYVLNLLDDPYEVINNGSVEQEFGISNCCEAYKLRVPVIDIPIFMPWLKNYIETLCSESDAACNFITHEIASIHDLFRPNYKKEDFDIMTIQKYDLIINCCGVYAKQLVNDNEVYPIRGQVVRLSSESLLPQGGDDSALSSTRLYQKDDSFTLVLPRLYDVVLGGTSQVNDWDRAPREEETKAILERCSTLDSRISQKSTIVGTAVGLRPGRKEIRLELEYLKMKDDGVNREDGNDVIEPLQEVSYPVIHNYGHGGGGLTVCYGCANEVVQLVQEHFNNVATFVETKS